MLLLLPLGLLCSLLPRVLLHRCFLCRILLLHLLCCLLRLEVAVVKLLLRGWLWGHWVPALLAVHQRLWGQLLWCMLLLLLCLG